MRCLTIVLLAASLVAGTSSLRVTRQTSTDDFQVEPHRSVVAPGGSLTLMANAGRPLQICHYWLPGPTGRLVDLSKGSASDSNDRYEYFGQGLDRGECGIKMKRVVIEDDGIVECKVLPVGSSQWEKNVATVRVTARPQQDLPVFSIVPRTAILSRGDDITITCNTNRAITLCHIYLPGGRQLNLDRGANSVSTNEYRYVGTGLQDGQCGAKLTGVDQRLTGYVVCKVGDWPEDTTGRWETDALKVETTDSPNQPQTEIPPGEPTGDSSSCPPLISQSLQIECIFAGEKVGCSNRHPIGTTAKLSCKPGYTKVSSTPYYTAVHCQRGGKWDRPFFTCVPDCGKRKTNKGDVLISKGKDVQVGEFPWHIGIYEKDKGTYSQICGGSLISPSIIISAAHCFWSEQTSTQKPTSKYKVAAGKHMREWSLIGHRIQKRDLQVITLDPLYRGRDSNYAYDIAILKVTTPFKITASVNLICMDWENSFETRQLSPENYGLVTGWGFTENNTQSDALRYVELPFITATTCQRSLTSDLKRLLTPDKFCAGYINRSVSVCGGDSGGGLVFWNSDNGKFYLRGVVSIAFTPAHIKTVCYSQQYTGFTQVSRFHHLIQETN